MPEIWGLKTSEETNPQLSCFFYNSNSVFNHILTPKRSTWVDESIVKPGQIVENNKENDHFNFPLLKIK